jgi:hypothetical protein
MGMLTRNDKTTTSNNRGVQKHIGNAKGISWTGKFSIWTIGGIRMLKVDGIGYNVQEHQEVHMGHCEHYSKKCFNR